MLDSEPKLNELKKFYADKLYSALNSCVLNSLRCLAQACGYEPNANGTFSQVSTTGNSDALKFIRLKSADDLTRSNMPDQRPLSVSVVLDNTNWVNGKKLEKAFLK